MAFLRQAGVPAPQAFRTAAEFILNLDLKRAGSEESIDIEKIRGIIAEINKLDLSLDSVGIEFELRHKCEGMIGKLCGTCATGAELSLLSNLDAFIDVVRSLPVDLNYWQMQNIYYRMAKTAYREFFLKAKGGDNEAAKWIDLDRTAGEKLLFNTEAVLPKD